MADDEQAASEAQESATERKVCTIGSVVELIPIIIPSTHKMRMCSVVGYGGGGTEVSATKIITSK